MQAARINGHTRSQAFLQVVDTSKLSPLCLARSRGALTEGGFLFKAVL